jgi:YidC/Oxa1 family membrane protein insertase
MDFLTSITDFFGRVFAPLTGLVGDALEFFYSVGAPWWLSIVILTVIVRTLLFPLTVRQVKSMRAMQDLRPEMEKIRAKYKDNKQKQQEEIMKLYQESGVNPFGSCLPLLVQLPIFITMFYVIKDFGYAHPDFTSGGILWFQDLSVQDPYYVLPILSAVTMLAASEIATTLADENFARCLYGFPSNVPRRSVHVLDHLEPGHPGTELRDLQPRPWQKIAGRTCQRRRLWPSRRTCSRRERRERRRRFSQKGTKLIQWRNQQAKRVVRER